KRMKSACKGEAQQKSPLDGGLFLTTRFLFWSAGRRCRCRCRLREVNTRCRLGTRRRVVVRSRLRTGKRRRDFLRERSNVGVVRVYRRVIVAARHSNSIFRARQLILQFQERLISLELRI